MAQSGLSGAGSFLHVTEQQAAVRVLFYHNVNFIQPFRAGQPVAGTEQLRSLLQITQLTAGILAVNISLAVEYLLKKRRGIRDIEKLHAVPSDHVFMANGIDMWYNINIRQKQINYIRIND